MRWNLHVSPVADDRVAGVVAALEADDDVGVLGEQVDDLALALIAPLGADDHDAWHVRVSVGGGRRRAHAAPTATRLGSASRRRSAADEREHESHISSSRETVRSLICSARSSRSRLVVMITARSSS